MFIFILYIELKIVTVHVHNLRYAIFPYFQLVHPLHHGRHGLAGPCVVSSVLQLSIFVTILLGSNGELESATEVNSKRTVLMNFVFQNYVISCMQCFFLFLQKRVFEYPFAYNQNNFKIRKSWK